MCPILPLKITKYSEGQNDKHCTLRSIALYYAGGNSTVLHYKGQAGKMEPTHSWGEKKNKSFQRETNNLQFKCIRDQAVPLHMQIDANDMQMAQSKPGFANVLFQEASSGVQPGPVCARSSHLGPRVPGVAVRLHSRKLSKTQRAAAPSLLPRAWSPPPDSPSP